MTTLITYTQLPAGGSLNGTEILAVTQSSQSVKVTVNAIKDFIEADSSYIATSERGTANGVASLDSTARVPLAQMPLGLPLETTTNQFTKNQSVVSVTLSSGSTVNFDASQSNNTKVILATNATLANPTNMTDGMILNFKIKQDSVGGRTLSYGTAFKFAGGVAPILSTTPNAIDFMSCYYDATDGVLLCNLTNGYA